MAVGTGAHFHIDHVLGRFGDAFARRFCLCGGGVFSASCTGHVTSPPETEMDWPVIAAEPGMQSHRVALATSSGATKRCCGLLRSRMLRASCSLREVLLVIWSSEARSSSVSG